MARNKNQRNNVRGKRNNNKQWYLIDEEQIDRKNQKHFLINNEPNEQTKPKKEITLSPRGENQKSYVNNLLNPNIFINFGIGPAGSGKTLLATQVAIKLLIEKKIEKIVITRPAVSVDEQHGFLPGSLERKLEPWLLPILDILEEHYSASEVQKMIKEKVIAIEPLAFMRGRTFKNSFIIGDEMQNSLPSQMKMLLTRIGEGSQMVITGDLKQHDRTYQENGLLDFIQKLENQESLSKIIKVNRFNNGDIMRHQVITEVLKIYNEID